MTSLRRAAVLAAAIYIAGETQWSSHCILPVLGLTLTGMSVLCLWRGNWRGGWKDQRDPEAPGSPLCQVSAPLQTPLHTPASPPRLLSLPLLLSFPPSLLELQSNLAHVGEGLPAGGQVGRW